MVVGVNSDDDIYEREGITSDNPTGTGWHKVPGKLMNIDIEEGEVVGTNSANNIFRFLHLHIHRNFHRKFLNFSLRLFSYSAANMLNLFSCSRTSSSGYVKLTAGD